MPYSFYPKQFLLLDKQKYSYKRKKEIKGKEVSVNFLQCRPLKNWICAPCSRNLSLRYELQQKIFLIQTCFSFFSHCRFHIIFSLFINFVVAVKFTTFHERIPFSRVSEASIKLYMSQRLRSRESTLPSANCVFAFIKQKVTLSSTVLFFVFFFCFYYT